MNEKQKDTNSGAQQKLKEETTQLLSAVEETEKELEKSYRTLAEEPKENEENAHLDQKIQKEIDSLKEVNNDLKQAHQRTMAMEDELSARFRDMQKSRDRKWYRLNPPANGTIDLEERQRKHFAQGINGYKLMLVCFVGSFAGVVYGPFNLLYGVGALTLTLALYRFRNRGRWLSFLGGMLVGSVVEYICSWGQELILGSRSWDYSRMPFNLNGRICLLYSCFWGVLGVLWIKDIYPRMAKWILKLPNRFGKIATWCVAAFLVVNEWSGSMPI